MSSIRNTIAEALGNDESVLRSYSQYIDDAVEALEDREENALAVIDRLGQALGASEEDINDILVAAGLREPTPEPTFDEQDNVDLIERMNTLIDAVERVSEQQRRTDERLDRAAQAAARAGVTF